MKKRLLIGLMAIQGIAFASPPVTSINANLKGSWEFNNSSLTEGTGNFSIFNSSNAPGFVSDRCQVSNNALSFNGVSNYIVYQTNISAALPQGQSARSLSFWVKNTNTTGPKAIFSYGLSDGTSGGGGHCFEINQNYTGTGIGLDVSNQALTSPYGCLNDNTWHHFAAVYTGASNVYATTSIYIDGVLQNPLNYASVGGLSQIMNTLFNSGYLYIGSNVFGNRLYSGQLDDVYLYDAALTFNDVQILYGAGCMINGNPTFCANTNIFSTPTVVGATNYAWTLPSGWTISGAANGPMIFVNASSGSGNISCVITTPCGTITRTIPWTYVNAGGVPLNLSVSNPVITLCGNANTSALLSASSTYAGPVTYAWQTSPVTYGNSVSVSPQVTTTYYVLATAAGYCPNLASVNVTVNDECCDHPIDNILTPTLPQTLTNATQNGGSYLITQNLTISGTVNFLNSEFQIRPNVKIIVPNGAVLNLDGSHLYSCGLKMWDGIEVQDGGQIITSNTSPNTNLIEDAKTAISLDAITTSHASPPININNVAFNKNHIGIKISNAGTGVTNLPIGVNACVFTCRNLPFTISSWPNTSTSDLRLATTPTTGLISPYLGQVSYPMCTSIKNPYSAQSSLYGIQIVNVGNVAAASTNPGVDINVNYSGAASSGSPVDFNLFDNLGVGIDITDANFTAQNNTFQNMVYDQSVAGMNGSGIEHRISTAPTQNSAVFDMNARLDLRPVGALNQSTDFGNRFWNCYTGIKTNNVYEVMAEYALFRSVQRQSNTNFSWGFEGMSLNSNRYEYSVKNSEFNNLHYGLTITNASGNYDMGMGPLIGIYAGNMTIEQNYFGPEVNSSNPIVNEYLGDAIRISGPNSPVYQLAMASSMCNIRSNKINRAFRGVSVNSMFDYPISMLGNLINLIDDNVMFAIQRGIEVYDNQGNLVISDNTLNSNNIVNMNMTLIYLRDNVGTNVNLGVGSPYVTCNNLNTSYQAFEFENNNANCAWLGNSMKTHDRGLVLTTAVIGQQGNPGFGCGNSWISCNWDTWCNNSSSNLSTLYVAPLPFQVPNLNAGRTLPYTLNTSYFINKRKLAFTCTPNTYPPLPSQRAAVTTGIEQAVNSITGLMLYPNPSNGQITIQSESDSEDLSVKVIDVTGKVVMSQLITTQNHQQIINLPIDGSVYFVELTNENGARFYQKVLITK
mgnify:CR=1 FL=1